MRELFTVGYIVTCMRIAAYMYPLVSEQLPHVPATMQSLVVLKWLGLQAGSNVSGNVTAVTELMDHAAFNINNPNKCARLMPGNALL